MTTRSGISLALFASTFLCLSTGTVLAAANDRVMSLAGEWACRLDPAGTGIEQKWYEQDLPDKIKLPGSLAENGYGDNISVDTKWTADITDRSWFTDPQFEKYRTDNEVKVPFWLSPVKYYVGPAWYQKEISIPDSWAGKHIALFLERCHWETQVWVDGKSAGSNNSLGTPQEYDLSGLLKRGRHRLTICVDNTVKINVGVNAHSVSDHTQGNWNGIVGAMELRATDPVYIDDIQVYPDPDRKMAKVTVLLANSTGKKVSGEIRLDAACLFPVAGHKVPAVTLPFQCEKSQAVLNCDYPMGDDVRLWNEFSPNVYTLTVSAQAGDHTASRSVDFGMRQICTSGTQFTINGRKTFIRGTLECCIFPLTGYPPTDVESWMRILKIAKAHGLNSLRFHSWCPPEAAFIAGDRMGFMYQIEASVWTQVGDNPKTDEFIHAEADRILKYFGNHPSFCLLAHGNEPHGPNQKKFLGELVSYWKQKDPRRLYTSGSGWPLIPENNYHVTPDPRVFRWGEGMACRLNAKPPETMTDYRDFVAKYTCPVISHEIGQWCVYPDFKEIERYSGVLKSRNFEIFRDSLKANHMLDQAEAFLQASGKLQTLCYKEDIESALRTPGFGGFQLLDLHDFPGQGTALVGVLNPFWQSKGYVKPEEYHRFCCETVPLARMTKRTWTTGETFTAGLEIAHFGPAPIESAVVTWVLASPDGRKVASGELPTATIPLGNGTMLGKIDVPLAKAPVPSRLVLTVAIKGTSYINDWDIWVYPPKADTAIPAGITLIREFNDQVLATLKSGGKVMLMPSKGSVVGDSHGVIPPGFTSIFWNTAWTRRQAPHTLGILCNPAHPALREFPTEFHSNWQWWDLVSKSQFMILNEFPAELRPIVQIVDDWVTNRRLGLVFEAHVNGGKLLVCGMDLETDLENRPVARQMRQSLLAYMNSEKFAPQMTVDAKVIQKMVSRVGCEVIKVDSAAPGHDGALACDDGRSSFWHTSWGENKTDFPHEIQIQLAQQSSIRGLRYLPRQDMENGWISDYEVYVSDDPAAWGQPVAKGTFAKGKKRQEIFFTKPTAGLYVRLVALKGFDGKPYAAIAELSIIREGE